ncbi:MAG TPA: GWxTD domain-containing protein [Candidatus Krumholzibacteria bacterium]|nr:GWxTD domain-containing protein [Candidatus Krumholzibacteria bacterium]
MIGRAIPPSPPRTAGVVAVALVLLLGGCSGAPGPVPGMDDDPWFEADVLAGLDEEGRPRATVTVSIPYRRMVFFREDQGYVSHYRLRAIQRVAGEAVQLREWGGTAYAEDFDETRKSKVLRRTVGMALRRVEGAAPGAQVIEVQVAIDGTRRRARRTIGLETAGFRSGGLTLGHPTLYRQQDALEEIPTAFEVMGHAMPDPAVFDRHERGPFDLATGPPWMLLRIFDLRRDVPDSTYLVTVRVVNEDTATSRWRQTFEIPRAGSETGALVRVPGSGLAFGGNRVRVSLPGTDGVEVEIENRGLDLTDGRSWEANLERIEIIAARDELERLRDASVGGRVARWRAFWQRRDPVPSTERNEALEEHHRRVAYARANLRDGFRDGALSDRGRIWLLHGPPQTIESSAPGFDSNERFEVWRYRELGLLYYFRDTDGFGTYRLVWREAI